MSRFARPLGVGHPTRQTRRDSALASSADTRGDTNVTDVDSAGRRLSANRGRGVSAPTRARRRFLEKLEPLVLPVVVLTAWQCLASGGILPQPEMPGPVPVARQLVMDLGRSDLWHNVASTLGEAAAGLALAAALGIPLGMCIGASRFVRQSTSLLVELLRPVPTIALVPLLILLFGVGPKIAIVLVGLTAFWPLLIQATYGVRDVDPVARDTGRIFGLSSWQRYTRIVLPSAAPYIATGLRVAAVYSLIMAIAASLIVGGSGIGNDIDLAAQGGAYALMYARVIVAGALGVFVTFGLLRIERSVLHWHHAFRDKP